MNLRNIQLNDKLVDDSLLVEFILTCIGQAYGNRAIRTRTAEINLAQEVDEAFDKVKDAEASDATVVALTQGPDTIRRICEVAISELHASNELTLLTGYHHQQAVEIMRRLHKL